MGSMLTWRVRFCLAQLADSDTVPRRHNKRSREQLIVDGLGMDSSPTQKTGKKVRK